MEEEKKDFVVKDRRIFSQDKAEETPAAEKKAEEKPAKPRQAGTEPKEPTAAEKQKQEARLPEINFQTFVFSLNASALVQLGLMEDPATGQKEKNLPLAKQTIDMLSMMEEKTRGNLTKEEGEMLKHVLYDLRIRYVKEKG